MTVLGGDGASGTGTLPASHTSLRAELEAEGSEECCVTHQGLPGRALCPPQTDTRRRLRSTGNPRVDAAEMAAAEGPDGDRLAGRVEGKGPVC